MANRLHRERELQMARAIVAGISDPAILVDRAWRHLHHNGAFATASGSRPRRVERDLTRATSPFELLGSCDGAEPVHLARVVETALPTHLAEIEVRNLAGATAIMKQSFIPIPDHRGEVCGIIVVFRDVTAEARIQRRYRELLTRERARADDLERRVAERTQQLSAALDQVRRISSHDFLTGLQNRRAFREHADQAWLMAHRHARHFGVIMCDLDHFKQVNDSCGHQTGDAVLVAVARALEDAVRATDRVARYGGEEFIILLTETSAADDVVETVAHRCADRIRRLPMAELAPGHPGRQTASLGVAIYPQHGATLDQLISHADQALYRAKRLGRDRVVTYADDTPTDPAVSEDHVRPHRTPRKPGETSDAIAPSRPEHARL